MSSFARRSYRNPVRESENAFASSFRIGVQKSPRLPFASLAATRAAFDGAVRATSRSRLHRSRTRRQISTKYGSSSSRPSDVLPSHGSSHSRVAPSFSL